MRDIGVRAEHAGDGGDTSKVASVVFEGYDVTTGDSVLGLSDSDEGGRSGESWDNEGNEGNQPLGEHGGL